jgi:hypothetical protein
MLRKFALALVAAATIAAAVVPAYAGPAETAFLQKLGNNWTGKGKLTGADSGPILCRIVITAGGQSAKYQGRCTIPDMAARAFNGSITYNEKLKRYESRSAGGTVPGVKRGNSLVFTDKQNGPGGTAYSTMTISPSSLVVDFTLINKNGEKTSSRVTFSK